MPDHSIVITMSIGVVIGLSSGLFGIGGALLSTPLLRVGLGLPELLSVATPLPAAIPSAISGTIAYARAGLVDVRVAIHILVIAIPLSIFGAYITKFTPPSLLMLATGVLLIYSAVLFLRLGFAAKTLPEIALAYQNASSNEQKPVGRKIPMAWLGGAIAGFMSGFLAIGGGAVLVPVLVKVLGMPMKRALATSLLCVAVLAIPGVAVHAMLGHIDWRVAGVLALVAAPFSYLGARLATVMRTVLLERIYGIAMMVFAIYFVVDTLKSIANN